MPAAAPTVGQFLIAVPASKEILPLASSITRSAGMACRDEGITNTDDGACIITLLM